LNFEYKKSTTEKQRDNESIQVFVNDREQKNLQISELRVELKKQENKLLDLSEELKIKSKNAADVFNLRDL